MSLFLLILAALLIAGSGVPALLLGRRSAVGQKLATGINVLASGLGIAALFRHDLLHAGTACWHPSYALPIGTIALKLDDLAAWFLLPIFLISALGSIYGLGYWPQRKHPANGRKLRLCWGLMTAAMIVVVLAANSVEFLIAWEIMALSGYFLLTTEDALPAVRQSGWVYLIATHSGTLCLTAFFILLKVTSGAFSLWPTSLTGVPASMLTVLFILGLIGFGFKAGLVPLHVWLPAGHANAPSHVSALFSGVMLNMGVYGIMRVAAMAGDPPIWWGVVLISMGMCSALLGIVWALAQSDFKRLLAYSSIENIGIIITGLGLAVLGLALKQPVWVALGLGGALLHTLNHSLFKPLLFMGAGGIVHATGTRDMESLGGLARSMPTLFGLMLLGSAAITAMPPLNGFISELLIYLGFLQTLGGTSAESWAALAVPALAMVGALAMMTFIKLTATTFAGQPRTPGAARAHDPGRAMLYPIIVLGLGCVLVGVLPGLLANLLDHALMAWTTWNTPVGIATIVPFWRFTLVTVSLTLLGAAIWVGITRWRRVLPLDPVGTWAGGYAVPTRRMQYTGSSLTQTVEQILRRTLWFRAQAPEISGIFPQASAYTCDTPDPLLDRLVEPAFQKAGETLKSGRIFQSGTMQLYLLYILLTLLILLLI